MTNSERVTMSAGADGTWRIAEIKPFRGATLPSAERLRVIEGEWAHPANSVWSLRGFSSNVRYANKSERASLRASSPALGRPEASLAALIPIRKRAEWWELAQDERRRIMEEDSKHISIGAEYLVTIARRLLHCRDIAEPFDFLTWFEYPPRARDDFEELVIRLRQTREWEYVEHEVDIRLERVPT